MNITPVIEAGIAGGNVVLDSFGKTLNTEEKTCPSDYCTNADKEAEKVILNLLMKKYPTFNFLSEESGFVNNNSDYTFIIDPLDGSNNFVLGIPNFSVSIGLMKNHEAILGVVYHPVLRQTYYAQKGKGAFQDKEKLSVSKEDNIQRATVSYTCGYKTSRIFSEKVHHSISELKIKRYLTNWSPALEYCLLAAGKLEAIINYKNEIYDFMAGKVIAQEAGEKITDFNGDKNVDDKFNVFIASNNTKIHKQLLKLF